MKKFKPESFIFIGDIHGNLDEITSIAKKNKRSTIIQCGDFGVGFIKEDLITELPKNIRFFIGNHDCRKVANLMSNCLGDFGEHKDKFFWVSGGNSIDKYARIENIDWWADEELDARQCKDCIDLWANSKIDVLVSHEPPQMFAEKFYLCFDRSKTRTLLDEMIKTRKPELVISAHWHESKDEKFNGMRWVSLGIKEAIKIKL